MQFTEIPKHPIVAQLVSTLFDWLAENSEHAVQRIRKEFEKVAHLPDVSNAINDLGYDPTPENLAKLSDKLEAHGADPKKLAELLVDEAKLPKATVKV